jgi:hypothetical protein
VLLIKYLETYLSDLKWWLREWRIAINVSKISTFLFAKASRCIPKLWPVQLFREPIQWVDTSHCRGMTLTRGLPGHLISVRLERKRRRDCKCWDLSKQEKSSAVQGAHPTFDGLHVPRLEVHCSLPYQETACTSVQMSLHCYQCTLIHW